MRGPMAAPSKHEAHVVRRDVPWLTADPVSSVNFTPLHELDGIITPNGLCFERHHAGIAEVDPAAYRLMINGLVDRPLVFTLEDLKRFPRVNNRVSLPGMRGELRHGVARRAAQRLPVHPRHDPQRHVHRRDAEGRPGRGGVKTTGKWVLPEGADASAMTRSIPWRRRWTTAWSPSR